MPDKNMIKRRSFLKGAAAVAAFSIVPRHVLGGAGYIAPSEQLTKAVIGVGGMGQGHLTYPGAKLVAICDVDKGHLASTLMQRQTSLNQRTALKEKGHRPNLLTLGRPIAS